MSSVIEMEGKAVDLDSCEAYESKGISLTHEVLVTSESGSRYVVVKRFKTPVEIFNELHSALDLSLCQCGHEFKPKKYDTPCPMCGKQDRCELIDEYDSCCHFGDSEPNCPIAPRDWFINSVMVWCEPGSNEGYSVYVTARLSDRAYNERKTVDVYRIKSFQGMDHCHSLVERIMKLMGIWM